MKRTIGAALFLAFGPSVAPASADFSYPGCPDLKPSDFRQVPLITNGTDETVQEPLKMAFDMDAQGNVDIYFTQRFGLLRKYSMARKTVVTVADFAFSAAQVPKGRNSYGLIGIALDPGFKTNRWMYLYIGLMGEDWRISRFVVSGDRLDPASEKVIFRFRPGSTDDLTHVAGALQFDADGNLWATVGDNGIRYQCANTNDYVGKILRIRPLPLPDAGTAPAPGPASTYDIPAGNLYPDGTAKTLPEIYVMGVRNPYTLAIDPVRKGIAWGDIGPDVPQAGEGTEEFNFTTRPGNFGYPFWAGNQQRLEDGYGTPDAPINERSDNTGLRELKPAMPATIPYRRACAVTGPFYYYSSAYKSPYRLPPHLDGTWLLGDFNLSWIDAVRLDEAGAKVLERTEIIPPGPDDLLNKPLDIQVGPDGVLYVINYSGFRTWSERTGLIRIEYTRDCHPVSLATPIARGGIRTRLEGNVWRVEARGPHRVILGDLLGRTRLQGSGQAHGRYDLRHVRGRGIYAMVVRTESGFEQRRLVVIP